MVRTRLDLFCDFRGFLETFLYYFLTVSYELEKMQKVNGI